MAEIFLDPNYDRMRINNKNECNGEDFTHALSEGKGIRMLLIPDETSDRDVAVNVHINDESSPSEEDLVFQSQEKRISIEKNQIEEQDEDDGSVHPTDTIHIYSTSLCSSEIEDTMVPDIEQPNMNEELLVVDEGNSSTSNDIGEKTTCRERKGTDRERLETDETESVSQSLCELERTDEGELYSQQIVSSKQRRGRTKCILRIIVFLFVAGLLSFLIADTMTNGYVKDAMLDFLAWIEAHPIEGLFVYVFGTC
jgi:hypothetical protein